MKELKEYVARKNEWNVIFMGNQYSLNSAVDRQAIADALAADLSPENLTCCRLWFRILASDRP